MGSLNLVFHFIATSRPAKRFQIPEADDNEAPEPVRLFHRRHEVSQATPAEPPEAVPEEPAETATACEICLQGRCITFSPFKPQGRSDARVTNHTKRRKDYKWYWRTLKDCGLWENSTCLERKEEFVCLVDDVREVMPHRVIKDARSRWPNPPHVPYQGHRRS